MMPRVKDTRRFTLMELLMVMAIMSVLTGLIIGVSTFVARRGAFAKTMSALKQMEIALDEYRHDWGFFPVQQGSTSAALEVDWDETGFSDDQGRMYLETYKVDSDDDRNNPYRDAWGQPFYYQCPGTNNPEAYDLWSTGRDKDHGEDTNGNPATNAPSAALNGGVDVDDITNWKRH